MSTVREILQQSGIDEYSINSLDDRVTSALQNVLTKAETDRVSVQDFWEHTYNPGVAAWEAEKGDLARKLATAESEKARLLAYQNTLRQQGLADDAPPQMLTPGTPQFNGDANEFVSRAARGLQEIADVDYKHRALFNAPMPVTPSELIRQADARGLSPGEFAERQFGFSKKESELAAQRAQEAEQRIRQDERAKIVSKYSDGQSGSFNPMAASGSMGAIRRATQEGKLVDPLKLDAAGRRKQALESIHRAVEERQQRDA